MKIVRGTQENFNNLWDVRNGWRGAMTDVTRNQEGGRIRGEHVVDTV